MQTEDSKNALVIVTVKILEKKMSDPIVRICLLTFKYIKMSTQPSM